jgi:hypothetical protein
MAEGGLQEDSVNGIWLLVSTVSNTTATCPQYASYADARAVDLQIAGLAPGTIFQYTVEVANASSAKQLVLAGDGRPTADGELHLTFDLSPPAVAYVRINAGAWL